MTRTLLCLATIVVLSPTGGFPQQRMSAGAFQDGRYTDLRSGVNFRVTAGWTVLGSGGSSDGGDMVALHDSVSNAGLSVWTIVTRASLEGVAAQGPADWYRHVIGMKIRQRYDQGLRDYWVAADTIQEKVIGGRMALAGIGAFTDVGSREPMAECLTWIVGDTSRAFFFAKVSKSNLEVLRARFEELVATSVIP